MAGIFPYIYVFVSVIPCLRGVHNMPLDPVSGQRVFRMASYPVSCSLEWMYNAPGFFLVTAARHPGKEVMYYLKRVDAA